MFPCTKLTLYNWIFGLILDKQTKIYINIYERLLHFCCPQSFYNFKYFFFVIYEYISSKERKLIMTSYSHMIKGFSYPRQNPFFLMHSHCLRSIYNEITIWIFIYLKYKLFSFPLSLYYIYMYIYLSGCELSYLYLRN